MIRAEKKRLVLNDRATNGAAKLIAFKLVPSFILRRLPASGEWRGPVSRVENRIADELKRISVKGVGSRLRNNVNHCAGILAIFGAVVTGLNAEFLQCIWIREWLIDIRVLVYIVAAVELVTDLILSRAVYGKRHRTGECLGSTLIRAATGGLDRTGCRQCERGSVAAIQGKFGKACLLDYVFQRRRSGINLHLTAGDLDDLGRSSQLQATIDSQCLVGKKSHVLFGGAETRRLNAHGVLRWFQGIQYVVALGVRRGCSDEAGADLNGGHLRSCQNSSRRICYGADDATQTLG